MGELRTKTFAGIDIWKNSIQISIFDVAEMKEECFCFPEEESEHYIEVGLLYLNRYMEANDIVWNDFTKVVFCLEDPSVSNRKRLRKRLPPDFEQYHEFKVITRFRGFVEYVFHQEKAVWDRAVLLLDYHENHIKTVFVNQIRKSREKAYQAVVDEIDLSDTGITEESRAKDLLFGKMIKKYLAMYPANMIYLTGKGFEGNWMKRTLNYLCAGRRVFMGQNIYANGACLLGIRTIPFMDNGMLLMQGPQMVYHTVGVVTLEGGRKRYVPITSIGQEWYNTYGTMDVILDKSGKLEFFYHNTKENEIECDVCVVDGLPQRPPKTTRLGLEVRFTSETEGMILLTDQGFGEMFPGTGKVFIHPFSLIS